MRLTRRLLDFRAHPRLASMPSTPRWTMLLAAALGAGCSAPSVDDIVDASGGTTKGIVIVERVVSGEGAAQTNVSAKFMRLGPGANVELAERIVGARLDWPPTGECMTVPTGDVDEKRLTRAALGSIELVDVGDVTVRPLAALGARPVADASSMPLAARAFPDVGDLVSGVFYTSRDAQSDLPAGVTYAVEGTGSTLVDRFSIEADAPLAPADVRIGDALLREGIAIPEGKPAAVRWQAPPAASRSRYLMDIVIIDVRSEGQPPVRCSFRDEGEAVLPAAALRGRSTGAVNAATIAFHRFRRRIFAASGVDSGELRFDLSVIGRAALAPQAP
jgi:hypothetical protein